MHDTTSYTAKMIRVNDLNVSYEDTGLSGRQSTPVIFVHGFPFDKSTWEAQLRHFGQVTRAISYDIRGFGDTVPGTEKASIDQFADDLHEFMNELKIEKAIVCGLSMGGYIILNALQRWPERFEAAVLCDTQCIADSPEAREKRLASIQQLESGAIKEFAGGMIGKLLGSEASANGDLHEYVRGMILRTPAKILTDTLQALANRSETCSGLSRIDVPVLVVCGREDQITPVQRSEEMAAELKQAELIVIDKAGHLSNLEQPEKFNKAMGRFLMKVLNSRVQAE